MRIAAAIAFVVAAVFFAAIESNARSSGSDTKEIKLTNMQAARLLIRAGKLEDAHVFLEQVQPQNEAQWIDRLFLLGRVEIQLGRVMQAIGRFERILKRHPNLILVRLELASAYYAAGLDAKSKYQFKSTLEYELPSTVEDVVEKFLYQINVRKPWSSSISVSLLPEAKPKTISSRDVVLIGGIPFELDNDSRPKSGIGLQISSGVAYSPIVAQDLRGLFVISATVKAYRRSVWNDINLATDVGVTQYYSRARVSTGFRLAWQWIANSRHRRSIGIWTRPFFELSEKFKLELPISVDQYKYDDQVFLDGLQLELKPSLTYFMSERSSIALEPRFERVNAEQPHHRNKLLELGLRYRHIFVDGMALTLSTHRLNRIYATQDPLLTFTRNDKQRRYSISLSHPSWGYKSFVPTLTYTHETNWSNFPAPRKFLSQGISLGLSSSF